jgi:hypothetical protein
VMGVCDKQEASAKEKGDGNIQQTRNKHWGNKEIEKNVDC